MFFSAVIHYFSSLRIHLYAKFCATNKATGIVDLTFFVDPGNRVYVRNIIFNGSKRINDEVLRREMRILEGGWLSNVSLDRSKQRLQRLPYITKVDEETTPVPGSSDQDRKSVV